MRTAAAFVALLLLAASAGVWAAGLDLSWFTIDGGWVSRNTDGQPNGLELSGTSAQPDAQIAPVMAGGPFQRTGGFWAALPVCHCVGDLNNDGLKNGEDIQQFVACVIAAGGGCPCADLDAANGVTPDDVALFVADLLAGATCP